MMTQVPGFRHQFVPRPFSRQQERRGTKAGFFCSKALMRLERETISLHLVPETPDAKTHALK